MKIDATMPRAAANALLALCIEYLAQGGDLPDAKPNDIADAAEALSWADRITITDDATETEGED